MANYIGKVQINTDERALIGSTLYGICYTAADVAAKDITINTRGSSNPLEGEYINTHYNNLTRGTTVHIKFIYGNTVTENVTLQVGTTTAKPVLGKFVCPANTVISFTSDETTEQNWVVNDNVNTTYTFEEGTTNGTIKVTSSDSVTAQVVSVHGLSDGAYKNVTNTIDSNNGSSTSVPTVSAVYTFVQEQTGGLAGLTGSMHFRGSVSAVPDATTTATNAAYISGDVILGPNDKEYVYVKGDTIEESQWIELGDESSYALKTSTASVVSVVSFTANTVPSLTTAEVTASKVTVSAGSAASLETTAVTIPNITRAGAPTVISVSAGVLEITSGTSTVVSNTPITVTSVNSFTANVPTVVTPTNVVINSVSAWSAGTAADLSSTAITVVVPS